MRWLVLLLLLPLTASAVWAPATTNVIDWYGNVGIPGGIPIRTTIYTNLDTTKVGGSATVINNAITACPSNQVVFMEAGTYSLSGKINLFTRSGRTLRGVGPGLTIINSTADACIETDGYSYAGAANLASGYTKGSTSVVFSATPNAQIAPGNLMKVDGANTNFVFNTTGPGRHLRQIVRVLTVSGTTVTFTPALNWNFTNLAPQAAYLSGGPGIRLFGIEDMTIIGANQGQAIIYLTEPDRCWVKNVEMTNGGSQFLWVVGGLQNEFRRLYIHDVSGFPNSPDGYGIYLYGQTEHNLIEDCIFSRLGCGILESSSSGNVGFANLMTNNNFQSWNKQTGGINMNHGAHPMMCLWEQNVMEQWQSDGYHGSASHQTIFRNYIHGLSANSGNRKMISAERGSWFFTVAFNILGHSSWSNAAGFAYEMTGEPDYTEMPVIYRLGYPNVGNNDTAETVDNAWQDDYTISYPDTNVAWTMIRHGNYDYKLPGIRNLAGEDTVGPDSLLYPSMPSYWGFLNWPAFNPSNPGAANPTNIPAGWRFFTQASPHTNEVPAMVLAGHSAVRQQNVNGAARRR
jgi:parallel beta-helix repeat protein